MLAMSSNDALNIRDIKQMTLYKRLESCCGTAFRHTETMKDYSSWYTQPTAAVSAVTWSAFIISRSRFSERWREYPYPADTP